MINIDADSDSEEITSTPIRKNRRDNKASSINGWTPESAAALSEIQTKTISLSKEMLLDTLTSFIVEDLQPISVLNDNGFQKLMTLLQMDTLMPSIDSVLANIDYLYGIETTKLKDVLKIPAAISVSIEQWESIMKDIYVTMRVNYIDDDWVPRSNVLATKKLLEPKTIEIYNKLLETVNAFEVTDKVVSIIYDGMEFENKSETEPSTSKEQSLGSNIGCFVAKLQTCIDKCLNSIAEVKNTLDKCKMLVSYFHHNEEADNFFKSYQKFLELPVESLIQYNPNEINSMYSMLDKLVKQKAPINSVMSEKDVISPEIAAKMYLTDEEWNIVQTVIDTLKPFQLAKMVIFPENKQEATISMVKPLVYSLCKNFYSTTTNARGTSLETRLKYTMNRNLHSIFKMYDPNTKQLKRADFIDIATYLDPRYKNQDYLDIRQKEVVRIDIKERLFKHSEVENDVASSPDSSATPKDGAGDTAIKRPRSAKALDILFPTTSKKSLPSSTEWTAYLNAPEIDKSSNIYEWWKLNESLYPELSKAARKYLCTLAIARVNYTSHNTQVRRACLTPPYMDKLIFLNNKLYNQ